MAKSTTTCGDILKLYLNATAIANIADNASSSPNTNTYLSLHTASPTAGGSGQNESEATYTSYARIAVARTSGGWTCSGATAQNTALAQFPACTGGTNTITHVGVGKASSAAGVMWWYGALNANLAVANLIQPQFSATALTITES